MRKFIFLAFLLCCGKAFCQDCKDQLVVGHIDSLHSNILGEERKLYISVPDSNSSDKRHPVLYLTDAELFFLNSEAMVQVLRDQIPDLIVVGIVNTDRNRDLLPTHVAADPYMGYDSTELKTSGGAEKFEQFIEKEVIPYVESKYPTAPYRILSGHSFGGVFTLYTFIHHNSAFNAWIVSDPSLWWDHQVVLKQARQFLSTREFKNEVLFLGVANSAQTALGLDTAWMKRDTSVRTYHMRSIFTFRDVLQQTSPKNDLRWQFKYFPEEVHGSVEPLNEFAGLKFIFGYYMLREGDAILRPNADAAGLLDKHYQVMSGRLGYPVKPAASMLTYFAYDALNKKDYNKAKGLFQLYIDDFPDDWNAYDSMGDYDVATGSTQKAITDFKKALSLKENPDSRKKLEQLLKR